MQKKNMSRRNFIQNASMGLGIGSVITLNTKTASAQAKLSQPKNRLPREVWIASFSLMNIQSKDYLQTIETVLDHMKEIAHYHPDIICLPEVFPFSNIENRAKLQQVAEKPPGKISRIFADFARTHHCYVICPIYTTEGGKYYNAAVVINRNGEVMGEYRKIHPTEGEMKTGIMPGPLNPPVFKLDFATIGIQICFDIQWKDGWEALRKAGAEMVFWPSAFAGGLMVNTKAWQNRYVVVSSTQKDTTKICDISGEELAKTGRWNRNWAIAPVNLEKVFLHLWPYVRRFPDIQAKYGREVNIKIFHEEEWAIIESLSPDIKVADIMKEFELDSLEEMINRSQKMQDNIRDI
jgi:beta-ureidopropionase